MTETIIDWIIEDLIVTLVVSKNLAGTDHEQWQLGTKGNDWVITPATAAAIIGGRAPTHIKVLS